MPHSKKTSKLDERHFLEPVAYFIHRHS